MMILTMFEQALRNTLKPVNGPGVTTPDDVRTLYAMMQVVLGDQPQVSLGASPVSPLNFLGDIVPVFLEIARHGLACGPLPCPSVGATSPMSLAGSLVQQNAENLASIVLVQLTNPGNPIVYCGRLSVLNMRSGAPIWGNPEVGMLSAGTVQLGHHYGLPVNVYGLAGSGFAADMQSGYERAINALVPALAGADELSGVGEMAGGTISSNFQIVVDDDIYGMVRRVLRSYEVNEDSLAVEVINHAMDHGRNFLKEQHSRRYLRAGEILAGTPRHPGGGLRYVAGCRCAGSGRSAPRRTPSPFWRATKSPACPTIRPMPWTRSCAAPMPEDKGSPLKYQINMQPVGRRAEVTPGMTLLAAAQSAGVELASLCGGVGVCDSCRVRLVSGKMTPLPWKRKAGSAKRSCSRATAWRARLSRSAMSRSRYPPNR